MVNNPHYLNKVFEQAVEAVIHGDTDTLKQLLEQHPALAGARSTRDHHATLLHYVAANGVEAERQIVPDNAVDIATILLEAGANPNATADFYGGGDGSTALVGLVTSVHPHEKGVQADLTCLFCKHGNPNGINDDGAPLRYARQFHYEAAVQALLDSGARDDKTPVTDDR